MRQLFSERLDLYFEIRRDAVLGGDEDDFTGGADQPRGFLGHYLAYGLMQFLVLRVPRKLRAINEKGRNEDRQDRCARDDHLHAGILRRSLTGWHIGWHMEWA